MNDVLWATGQVVKLNNEDEHTRKALEIWAFFSFGGCSPVRVFRGVQRGVHEDEHGGVQRGSRGVHDQGCSSFFASLISEISFQTGKVRKS